MLANIRKLARIQYFLVEKSNNLPSGPKIRGFVLICESFLYVHTFSKSKSLYAVFLLWSCISRYVSMSTCTFTWVKHVNKLTFTSSAREFQSWLNSVKLLTLYPVLVNVLPQITSRTTGMYKGNSDSTCDREPKEHLWTESTWIVSQVNHSWIPSVLDSLKVPPDTELGGCIGRMFSLLTRVALHDYPLPFLW